GAAAGQTQVRSEANAQQDRIQKLEERVAFLERALTELMQRQHASPGRPEPQAVLAPAQSESIASVPRAYEPPPELVPEIGKIGAQVGLFLGGASSPFRLDRGSF